MDVFALVRSNMKRIREGKQLSQEELSERMAMTQGNYSRLESSEDSRPTLQTLVRVALALECDIQELFVDPKKGVATRTRTPKRK